MDKIFSEEPVEGKSHKFKRFFSPRNIFYTLIIVVLFNLIYLDIIIFQDSDVKTIEKIISNPLTSQSNKNDETFCSQACLAKINEVAASLNKTTPIPTSAPAPAKAQPTSGSTNAIKEYYVPFGSGNGSSSDWQDVSGLQAYVDSLAYGNITNVVFEASLHIPTGNETVSIRLVNATDGRVIANSELDFNGNTSSAFLSSPQITLDYGQKLYKVQIKTQLGYPATIDQSRIHITAQ
jgi:hypothetical protein